MATAQADRLRNLAIVAHVDHGKTTLVDQLFRTAGVAGRTLEERALDRLELERERGITIAAKNCAVTWKGVKINILDTPGHADFGGEVERALSMVDGALLLVDAAEGPLPQTRFVLGKVLEQRLAMVVVINKIDRADARPAEVLDAVYDLFIDLGADEEQIEFPVLYAVGRDGVCKREPEGEDEGLGLLLDTLVATLPPPRFDPAEPFQMRVANLDYSEYLGRLAIGRVVHGTARESDELVCMGAGGAERPLRVTRLQVYDGLEIRRVEAVGPGEIAILAGIDEVEIGDTICTREAPRRLPRIAVEEPTVAMRFGPNTSPLAGREGDIVQARKIRDRLHRETLQNVAIAIEPLEDDTILVKGRGELQMAILIETLRREGFELTVGRPQILYREAGGERLEPIEHLYVDCPEALIGVVSEKLALRKGRMLNLVNHGSGRVRMEYSIPARGLIGYRSEFLTDTRGAGILNGYLEGYEPYRGDFPSRITGSLVADRGGEAVAYALFHLEPRGTLFVRPGDPVYRGMIIGEHSRERDLIVNPCKTKKLTNMRAAGRDENILLAPVPPMTLERAIEFIKEDEAVEVTPRSIRLRKLHLDPAAR
ncbi:MAG: translational GTPase TypA [Nitrospirae bacterium]|nr:MAG: translational GTPase TypA [Nitrospirota bacterium]